jgi:hypothetical protein
VGQAAENGTVRVKSGQATWSSPLQLNKGINLIGAGVGVTTITANVPMQDEWTCGYLIKYNPSDYVVDHPVRISSFTFDLNNKSSAIELGPSRKTVPPIFTVQTKARVDNNLFVNQSNDVCHALWFSGPVRGVVDSNVFTNIAYPARADAGVSGSWWQAWQGYGANGDSLARVHYGKAEDNLYFEDNVYNQPAVMRPISDCQGSGRLVYRYNTIYYDKSDAYPLFDMHGNHPGGLWSCFGGELYGNKVIAGSKGIRFLDQRGGTTLVFGNQIETTSSTHEIQLREERADSLESTNGNPVPQHISDTYIWNNRVAGSQALWTVFEYEDCCGAIAPNKEYFVQGSSFSGSAGVGCGLPAARPLACTVGVAYYATTQDCSKNDPRNIGARPAAPFDGTLYKCTATNTWTEFFKPAPYPHPLRSTVVVAAPAPPTGFRIIP